MKPWGVKLLIENRNLENKMSATAFSIYVEYYNNNPRFANGDAAINDELLKKRGFWWLNKLFLVTAIFIMATILVYIAFPLVKILFNWNITDSHVAGGFLIAYIVEMGFLFVCAWLMSRSESKYWKGKEKSRKTLTNILREKKLFNVKSIDIIMFELDGVIKSKQKSIDNSFSLIKWYVGICFTMLTIFVALKDGKDTTELITMLLLLGSFITLYIPLKFAVGHRVGEVFLNELHNLEFLRSRLDDEKLELTCGNFKHRQD